MSHFIYLVQWALGLTIVGLSLDADLCDHMGCIVYKTAWYDVKTPSDKMVDHGFSQYLLDVGILGSDEMYKKDQSWQ